MKKAHKILDAARTNPRGVRFEDLCVLVLAVGFVLRSQVGSHRIFRHATRREIRLLNLQKLKDGKAKPYQVAQVLAVINDYALEVLP